MNYVVKFAQCIIVLMMFAMFCIIPRHSNAADYKIIVQDIKEIEQYEQFLITSGEPEEIDYLMFLYNNKNTILDIIRNSYIEEYPQSQDYLSIGEALDNYFERPIWSVFIGPLNVYGDLVVVWEISFTGITSQNGKKVRIGLDWTDLKGVYINTWKPVTEQMLRDSSLVHSMQMSRNDMTMSDTEKNDLLADIFLN
jgi:hypothetical protein